VTHLDQQDDQIPLTARVVRVYGTDDQFGKDPRTNPLEEPITLRDFPQRGDRAHAWLGAVPSEVADVEEERAAIGSAYMRQVFGGEENRPIGELVEEARERSEPKFKQYSWYVTLSVERATSLPSSAFNDQSSPLWLDHGRGVDAAIKFARQFEDVFEVITSVIVLRLGGTSLEHRVVDDHVHFFRGDGSALSLPEASLSGSLSVGRDIASLHLDDLATDLEGIASSGLPGLSWFSRAAHWHTAAQETRDTWQGFEFAFFALEVLIHKIEPRLREEAGDSLVFQPGGEAEEVRGAAVRSLMWDPEHKQPLLAKFATVALCLTPESAEGDIALFADLNKRRGRLAHGQIKNADELPTSAAKGLTAKYLQLALRRFL